MECVFCSVIKNNTPQHVIVWEDDKHLAFLDSNPVTTNHTLVIPKKHIADILNLSKEEYGDLMVASREVALKIKEEMKCHKISILVEGLSVPHVHVHLVPLELGQDLIKFIRQSK